MSPLSSAKSYSDLLSKSAVVDGQNKRSILSSICTLIKP
jgi:hypothetical protein